ncbi:MAG: hypothetical protein N2444_02260 [Methylocystis sp.]|nr:hypothetical protein [Methylocystis sp.]
MASSIALAQCGAGGGFSSSRSIGIHRGAGAPPPREEGRVSERDPDAAFTKKNGKRCFGYKAHFAVDEDGGLAHRARMRLADPPDSQKGEKPKALKIAGRIAFKGGRDRPLVDWRARFRGTTARAGRARQRDDAALARGDARAVSARARRTTRPPEITAPRSPRADIPVP